MRTEAVAKRAALGALVLALVVGWLPVPDAMLRTLEGRFRRPQGSLEPYVGVVVLGGRPSKRLPVPVELMRQYPHLRMLYVGGESLVPGTDGTPVSEARLQFSQLGGDARRALYEEASRTTYENAVLGAAVPGIDRTQPWLLVTSARHMPRSMATFRAAGWNVTPYPVDYLAGASTAWTKYSVVDGAIHWYTAVYEYLGMAFYVALGRATAGN